MAELDDEAKKIMANIAKPDAEADIQRELPEETQSKRGRPKGKNNKQNVKVKVKSENEKIDFKQSAIVINTMLYTATCLFTGTGEAFPKPEKAEIMDKALERYLQIKDFVVSPEMLLLSAYSSYIKDLGTNETVKNNLSKRFTWFNKINIFSKLKIFKKENVQSEENKKGWLKK